MSRRFKEKARKPGTPPTFLCRNRAEVTRALAEIREHMGLTQLDLDDLAGFASGYTGKLERPEAPSRPGKQKTGRSALHPTFDWWVGALKVDMILVPHGIEADMASARPPLVVPPRMTVKRAEKIRALHDGGKGHSANTLWRMFQVTPKMMDDILAGRAYLPAQTGRDMVSA